MEILIDNMLESIFGGFDLQLNIIGGVLLIVVGIIILAFLRKQTSKGKRMAGWISLV